jgi:hypothetical protein
LSTINIHLFILLFFYFILITKSISLLGRDQVCNRKSISTAEPISLLAGDQLFNSKINFPPGGGPAIYVCNNKINFPCGGGETRYVTGK